MQIRLKRKTPSTIFPSRGSNGAAGYDVYATRDYEIQVDRDPTLIPLDIALEIPKGHYVSIVPRSSLGAEGVIVVNSPATIDSDYRGFIKVMLKNIGWYSYYITKGDRIAQLILHKYEEMEFVEADELCETPRGEGGFGSTGK